MNRLKAKILGTVAAGFSMLAWMLLLVPATAAAQQRGNAHGAVSARQSISAKATGETRTAAGPLRGDGSQEGIKVHGHWVIEVRDPDGSLVSRREFENSLVPGDSQAGLAKLLSGSYSVLSWGVGTNDGSADNGPCFSIKPLPCAATVAIGVDPATNQPDGTLVLTATPTAKSALTIQQVFTEMVIALAGGSSINVPHFSSRVLNPAVNVVAGQIISFTVTFTFS